MAGPYTVDSSVFQMRMRQLKDYLGHEMAAQVLPFEAKYLMQGVVRVTPPFGKGSRRRIGVRAIERDILRTMKPMSWKVFTRDKRLAESMRSLEQKGDFGTIAKVLAALHSGVIGAPQVMAFNSLYHTKRRDSRGHVSKGGLPIVIFGNDEALKLYKYGLDVQKRIGWTLSGWRAAAQATGVELPTFATQQAPSGYVQILDGEMPSITIRNGSNKSPILKNQVSYIMKGREKALATKVKMLMDGKATNIGFATMLAK